MTKISRDHFDGALANTSIDLANPRLGAALEGTSLSPRSLDALDGKRDSRVTGQQAIDDLYDRINDMDRRTSGLSSKQELAVWTAVRGAAIAPAPLSRAQGAALAAAARKLVAADIPSAGRPSQWSLEGVSACQNPAVSSAGYAGRAAWKCNVFAGEAFYRAGLPFPVNAQGHYATANSLPSASRFFQPLPRIDDVRAGDLVSIARKDDSGHVEIVTGVQRGPDGRVVAISSAGAHEPGAAEGDSTAAPLVAASATNGRSATFSLGGETYRLLRPMVPPSGGPR
jgi:hypothetical protein